MLSNLEITQYISTKLCHDLAGTLGAVNSGVDFINSDNPTMREKAIDLIKTSSEQSVHRLIFFRQTYGVSKQQGEANLDELKKVASDYLKSSKVSLNFHEKYFHIPGVFISASLGKLILALVHNSYTNLIHGGEIDISINKNGETSEIIISANGPSVKLDHEKIDILNGGTNIAISTSNCIAFYSRSLIELLDIDFKIESSEDNVRYIINF